MKPIEFKNQNVVFAKDQPQYRPLPAYKDPVGMVTTCWNLSFMERIKLLITGNLWVSLLTFNKPLQPILLDVDYPLSYLDDTETSPVELKEAV